MNNVKTKNYLNDVSTLIYSKESKLKLLKGELAILYYDYIGGLYSIDQYETRKASIESKIEGLSRTMCV